MPVKTLQHVKCHYLLTLYATKRLDSIYIDPRRYPMKNKVIKLDHDTYTVLISLGNGGQAVFGKFVDKAMESH